VTRGAPGVPGEVSRPRGRRYRGAVSDSPSHRTDGSDPASGHPASTKVRHRPSWIAFVVLGAIVCLGMGLWQLARYQEATGTVQNLGYTFMWPFLAGFLVYAYLKYIRLEAEEADTEHPAVVGNGVKGSRVGDEGTDIDDDEDDDPVGGAHPRGRPRRRSPAVTEIPADLLPSRRPAADARTRDEGLDAYNSYLAELARKDAAADNRHQERHAT
jgi:DNA-binding transcriptional regulator of glucitol operon